MIKDFFFVLRLFAITIVVVLLMQVKVGQKTVDDHFSGWLKSSAFVDYVQEAVDGGLILTKTTYKKVDNGVHIFLSKISHRHGGNQSGERGIHFNLKRYNEGDDEEDVADAG